VHGDLSGTAGVAIARRSRKGRLIVVSEKRDSENAALRQGQISAFYVALPMFRDAERVLHDESRGLLVAGELGGHGRIVGDRGEGQRAVIGEPKSEGALEMRALPW